MHLPSCEAKVQAVKWLKTVEMCKQAKVLADDVQVGGSAAGSAREVVRAMECTRSFLPHSSPSYDWIWGAGGHLGGV